MPTSSSISDAPPTMVAKRAFSDPLNIENTSVMAACGSFPASTRCPGLLLTERRVDVLRLFR